MKLKRIAITGFKSFPDRSVIDFQQGMTVIVGPNGTGKSNIIEAIRWGMGEQRAKDLRGSKMTDVIFAGTAQRAAINRAEVVLTLDNSDGSCDVPAAEIAVTRRLYRSGESYYAINGQSVRLRDVRQLFLASGLGNHSFAMINQGRVEQVFSAKATERREILEEVAGVHYYQQNKRKAESELAETAANLTRVTDIVREVQERLAPLAAQREQAERYLADRDLERQLLGQQLVQQYTAAVAEYDQQQVARTAAESSAAAISVRYQEQQVVVQAASTQCADAEQAIHHQQQALVTATAQAERQAGQRALLDEKITAAQDRLANAQQLREQLTAEQTQVARAATACHADIVQQQKTQAQLAAEMTVGKQTTAQADYQALIRQEAQLQEACRGAESQLMTLTAQHEQLAAEQAALQAQAPTSDPVTTAPVTEATRHHEHQAAQAAVMAAEDQVVKYRATRQSLLTQLARADAVWSAYQQTDKHLGFREGVKALLKARDNDHLAGIYGPVADYLVTTAENQTAIETALGGSLQHVIVADEQAAKAAIQFLREQQLGRVTLLPLTTVQPRTQLPALPVSDTCIGRASDLVTLPDEMAAITSRLLGNTIVTTTLAAALTLAKTQHYRSRVVSQDGQLVNAGGSVTGGRARAAKESLLQRHDQGQQLRTACDNYRQRIATLDEQLEQAGAHLVKAQQQERECYRQLADWERDYYHQQQAYQQWEAYQAAVKQVTERVTAVTAAQVQQKTRLATLTSDHLACCDALAHHQKQLAASDAEQAERQQRQQQCELTLAAATAKYQQLQAQITTLEQRKQDAEVTCVSCEQQLATCQTARQACDDVAASADVARQQAAYQAACATAATCKERLTAASAAEQQLRDHDREKQQHLENMTRCCEQQRESIAQLGCRIEEYYQQPVTAAVAQSKDSQTATALAEQLTVVQQRLSTYGPINEQAIAEHHAVAERYDFLLREQSDLVEARDVLTRTINDMDAEVITRLAETYTAVAAVFTRTYQAIFGGGNAELIATHPQDWLSTGIEIAVQPPGKKCQQLSLLSGGEKALTALALLFAIIQVRPLPFVILDEAEAALDEANVTRLAKYLKSYAAETQFIVITHRYGTMAAADYLHGVTMQTPGVSQLITVALDDQPADSTS